MMREHPEWTVVNRGINGQSSDEILARFERDAVQERPAFVIILAGVNDVHQGVPVSIVEQNLREMYEKAISARITPIAATVLPYNTASDKETKAIQELNSWISETAKQLGIPCCDTNRAVRDTRHPNQLSSSPDGLHPDVAGYRKMADAFSKLIFEHLERIQSSSS
jgi:lysophospholipase L1-like esterase